MKYIAIAAVVACLANPISANAFGLGDLKSKVGLNNNDKKASASVSNTDRCAAPSEESKNLTAKEKATAKAIQKSIDWAVNKLTETLGGTEPVGKVSSYCDADKKVAAVGSESLRMAGYVKHSVEMSLVALENDKETEELLSYMNDDSYSGSGGSSASFTKAINKNAGKAEKLAKKAQVANAALLRKSLVNLGASLKPGALIFGHDMAMVNFVKENPRWILDNKKQAKSFASQLKLLTASAQAAKKITSATFANKNLGINKKAIAKEQKKQEKKLEKESQGEFENMDLDG